MARGFSVSVNDVFAIPGLHSPKEWSRSEIIKDRDLSGQRHKPGFPMVFRHRALYSVDLRHRNSVWHPFVETQALIGGANV